MNNNGFIKLSRKLLDWEWFSDSNTLSVFIYCLLRANHEKVIYRGVEINRGSFTTSLSVIAKSTGLSIQQTRTALSHIELTGEITKCSTSKYTLITVNNYDKYQSVNKVNNTKSTNYQHTEQQPNNKQSTTNKNNKEILSTDNIRNKEACGAFSPRIDYSEYAGTFEVKGR